MYNAEYYELIVSRNNSKTLSMVLGHEDSIIVPTQRQAPPKPTTELKYLGCIT
jgi:hypothetical protein